MSKFFSAHRLTRSFSIYQAILAGSQKIMRALRLKKLFGLRLLRLTEGSVEFTFDPDSTVPLETWLKTDANDGGFSNRSPGLTKLLGYSVFKGALVAANPRYSAIIAEPDLILAPGPPSIKTRLITSKPSVSGLLRSEDESVLVKLRTHGNLSGAIYAGSLSPHNWYHWVIDFLPTLFLARRLPQGLKGLPVLVPSAGLEKLHWREMLDIVLDGREFIPLPRDQYLRVESLVWVHGPTVRAPSHAFSSPGELAIEKNTFNEYRAFVLNKLGIQFDPTRQRNRVFLDRSIDSLRPYNRDEILNIAAEYGFVPLDSRSSTIRETIETILHAEFLVGPHGAGWANALFAEQARAALIWTWKEAMSENWFHNVLGSRDVSTRTITTGPGSNSTGYKLEGSMFRRALEDTLV